MKPLRFLLCVVSAYLLGFLSVEYFRIAARFLNQPQLMLAAFVLIILFVTFFGWIYFRGVRGLSWRARLEVIAAWTLLIFLADIAVARGYYGVSILQVSSLTWISYALKVLGLFAVAWVTMPSQTAFTAPDLLGGAAEKVP